jgi:hypothetical protein
MTASPTDIQACTSHRVDALDMAVEAYNYAYPLVLMDTTRRIATSLAEADCEHGSGAPLNQFSHLRDLHDAASTNVSRPNLDTLYSTLWFDVKDEPLVISVPEGDRRFYSLSMLDYWSEVFAAVGSRTTGNAAQRFAVVGPSWTGTLPEGIRVYRSPTALGWIIGLTQLRGAEDIAGVARFQAALSARPWSVCGRKQGRALVATDPFLPMGAPRDLVAGMSARDYFGRFCELTLDNPPHLHDCSMVDRMKQIGLIPGRTLDPSALSRETRMALDQARSIASSRFTMTYQQSCTFANGWRAPGRARGAYGLDYSTRAAVAFSGLGVPANEDAASYLATKDSAGEALDSSQHYTLTFTRNQHPPVQGFWSLTLYNDRHLFADNLLGRFALGTRTALLPGRDGSTTIYIQRESPGPERERNWLPAPRSGGFSLALRLYWSNSSSGPWSPPPLRRSDDLQTAKHCWSVPSQLQ